MKKFQFKLMPVLRYRRYREKIAQIAFVKAKQAVLDKQKQIATLIKTRDNSISELKQKEEEGVPIARYRLYVNYIQGLEISIDTENKNLIILEKEMIKRQKFANTERIKREIMDKMEQKEKEAYIKLMIQNEQKSMDELTGLIRKDL